MIKLSKQQINSIAQDLDIGMNCYIHKKTGESITVPHNLDEFDDTEIWEEELKKVNDNRDQYILIEKIESYDSFKILRRFLGKVSDPKLREKLMIAISQNKPFQRFRNILDYNGDVLKDWYQFKQEEIEKYIIRHLKNHFEEEE
ncbi:MAG: UPF0158 family protein [Saprospiraceae bacterium]